MSEPTASTVRLSHDGAIATLTLHRPAARNALDLPMACALRDAVDAVAADPRVRVVLIESSGAHFMVGGDVHRFNALLGGDAQACRDEVDQIIIAVHAAIRALTALPSPVIGLTGGAVAGFGFSLAMACDLLVAADDVRFVLAYSAIGATLDGGASWHLPRLLGLRRALAAALRRWRALERRWRGSSAVVAKGQFWERAAALALNERQIKVLNRLLDGFEGKMTSSKWAVIAKCSQDTANRDIAALLDLGLLRKGDGGGRSTHYELVL